MSNLTRRAVMRGMPAAAIAAAATVGRPVPACADDAGLLDLEARHRDALVHAAAAGAAAGDAAQGSALDRAADDAWDAVHVIEDAMIDRPAAGLAGVLAKARLARFKFYDGDEQDSVSARAALALVADLERLAIGGAL